MKELSIHTDGGSFGNPGPGGYGVVLKYKQHRKELSGAFCRTTNNRMEIIAAIKGLESLTEPCAVTIFSDSKYVVNAISKGWARKWQRNSWMRNKTDAAVNPDLWARLLVQCDKHDVVFQWVKGHAGDVENERCDVLCKAAAKKPNLPADAYYESLSG